MTTPNELDAGTEKRIDAIGDEIKQLLRDVCGDVIRYSLGKQTLQNELLEAAKQLVLISANHPDDWAVAVDDLEAAIANVEGNK